MTLKSFSKTNRLKVAIEYSITAHSLRQRDLLLSIKNQVYKHIEMTGTSNKSMEDAVNTALKRAGETLENLSWFEIVETRGSIEKNQVKLWQVTIKVGFAVK